MLRPIRATPCLVRHIAFVLLFLIFIFIYFTLFTLCTNLILNKINKWTVLLCYKTFKFAVCITLSFITCQYTLIWAIVSEQLFTYLWPTGSSCWEFCWRSRRPCWRWRHLLFTARNLSEIGSRNICWRWVAVVRAEEICLWSSI